jgi:hypothetical protein
LRKYSTIIAFLFLATSLSSVVVKNNFETFCDVWGAIYLTENAAEADFKVYVHDDEAFADVLIFKEDQELFADRTGHWYMTSYRGFAKYSVFLVEDEGFADFTVYFTETESFAGCYDD